MSEEVELMEKLWLYCRKFVVDQKISCPEAIHQCDWVMENAYEFIEGVADIVGYHEYED